LTIGDCGIPLTIAAVAKEASGSSEAGFLSHQWIDQSPIANRQ
jgi:hypothetical protein